MTAGNGKIRDKSPERKSGKKLRIHEKVPSSRPLRIALGILLILGGLAGALPILGFWMLPLGVLVLSVDFPSIRRLRRRFTLWLARRRGGKR